MVALAAADEVMDKLNELILKDVSPAEKFEAEMKSMRMSEDE